MAEDFREDPGEFYPGGTVVPGLPTVVPGGGGSSVIVDDALTKDGENPVKSKGIWSAIWGAIAAPAASVYAWVTTELGKKQDKLKQGENITIDEDGTISASGGSVDVVAEIAGKEIKPSSVVVEYLNEEGGIFQRLILDGCSVTHEDYEFSDGTPKSISWSDLVIAAKKYDFHECETEEYTFGGIAQVSVDVHSFKINHLSTESFSGAIKNIILWILKDGDNVASDLILVFDCYVEGYRIEWTEDGREYTFHPRGGDAANLEVAAGKRNVFFITEVQPNEFMVARDELELPDAGGGE